ncbi:MAG: serine acetyltransferase [Gemmatimonadetes bacterium]|nr:serine acetyltransferase [Gemmatimonadota bacterium]
MVPPDPFLGAIATARRDYPFPRAYRELADRVVRDTMALLFPHFIPAVRGDAKEMATEADVAADRETVRALLHEALEGAGPEPAPVLAARFIEALPRLRESLVDDAKAISAWDPAAEELDEVFLAYPGFLAIAVHRLAHEFYRMKVPVFPRLLAEWAHARTGIDLHPGASVGRGFAIDHGTGIVIGETSVIGDRVKIYQGVTLGALSVQKGLAGAKRHPTIEDDVVIYAGATILGGTTVVGKKAIIGGNTWITASVPPGSVVLNAPQAPRTRTPDDDVLDYVI